jgi:ADP-ribose pyrophosphatase
MLGINRLRCDEFKGTWPMKKHKIIKASEKTTQFYTWGEYDIEYNDIPDKSKLVRNLFRLKDLCNGAGALVRDSEDFFYLNYQYRDTVEEYTLEIPCGRREGEETLEETARREVEEELGMTLGEMEYLGEIYPDTGVMDHRIPLYLAKVAPGVGVAQTSEGILEIRKYRMDELREMVRDGSIKHAGTIAAIALYLLRRKAL